MFAPPSAGFQPVATMVESVSSTEAMEAGITASYLENKMSSAVKPAWQIVEVKALFYKLYAEENGLTEKKKDNIFNV